MGAGLFPSDLTELFPWEAFFLGTQRDYLMKEAGRDSLESVLVLELGVWLLSHWIIRSWWLVYMGWKPGILSWTAWLCKSC